MLMMRRRRPWTRRRRRSDGRACRLMPAWRICTLFAIAVWTAVARADNAQYSMNLIGITSGTTYTIDMSVGTTASGSNKTYRIIADTGSSTDAVLGAGCCGEDAAVTFDCSASSTCKASDGSVTLDFAGATAAGHFVHDQWYSNATGSVMKDFLVIEQQKDFYRSEYEGITGLAYKALKKPQSSPKDSLYENLVAAKAGTKDAFGMQLCGIMQPMTESLTFTLHAGQWVIGGIDGPNGESYHVEPILYAPIVQESWYTVTVTDIGFDGKSLGLPCSKYNEPQAIIDSGTSNMAFPSDVYNALMTKITAATVAAVPGFDTSYMNYQQSCCGVAYCDPTNAKLALLSLPSIYISLAMDDGSSTKQSFTVEIPPQYYFRPEMNGQNTDTPCRVMGIAEASSVVLGDVFMDGLFTYHDREGKRIGIAVADNCPNGVKSTKKVYKSNSTANWCSCFSDTQKMKSRLASLWPWGGPCFFMLWWMYVVLVSVVVVLVCVGVVTYWWWKGRRSRDKLAVAAQGTCRRYSSRASQRHSSRASWRNTHPSLRPTRSGDGSSHGDTFPDAEDAQHYDILVSPSRDTVDSRRSSVVMLGASAENPAMLGMSLESPFTLLGDDAVPQCPATPDILQQQEPPPSVQATQAQATQPAQSRSREPSRTGSSRSSRRTGSSGHGLFF